MNINKIILATLLGISFIASNSIAQEYRSDNGLTLAIKTGIRQDNVGWKISSETSNNLIVNDRVNELSQEELNLLMQNGINKVNTIGIISELDWKDLNMYEVKAEYAYDSPEGNLKNFHIDGEVNYAKSTSGKVDDHDWTTYNRTYTVKTDLSSSKANGSYTHGEKMALGYNIKPNYNDNFVITPLIGYSDQKQKLFLKRGVVLLNNRQKSNMPFYNKSSYETHWYGPFAGIQIETNIAPKHSIKLRAEYHRNQYYAKGNWVLRDEFIQGQGHNFAHKGNGKGIDVSLSYNYKINNVTNLNLTSAYRKWEVKNGKERLHFSNGHIATPKLDKVKWDYKSILAGVSYSF